MFKRSHLQLFTYSFLILLFVNINRKRSIYVQYLIIIFITFVGSSSSNSISSTRYSVMPFWGCTMTHGSPSKVHLLAALPMASMNL